MGTISQVNGHFVLNDLPYGNVNLTISMIGFEDMDTSFELDSDFYDMGKIMMKMDGVICMWKTAM